MAADTASLKRREALVQMACTVDVLDVCGRLLSDPERAMVSLADKIAMAMVVERAWAACLEAQVLVTAIERSGPEMIPDETRRGAVAAMAARFREQIAPLLGAQTTNEET